MSDYRGTRGVRNYRREAAELIPTLKKLGIGCVVTLSLTAALLVYTLYFASFFSERRAAGAVVAAAVFERGERWEVLFSIEHNDSGDLLPLVPMYWEAGVFFDRVTGKMIFPRGTGIEVDNYYYYAIHRVRLEGLDMPRRDFHLGHGALVMGISQGNGDIGIYARRGVFIRQGYTDEYEYIQIFDPRDYYTVVIIDPGHGGSDPGAPSAGWRGRPYEADIVLAITMKLLEIFDEPGILLVPTRTENVFVRTQSRANIVNNIGDYFISIHCNAVARNPAPGGTLTLYGYADGSRELARGLQDALVAVLDSRDRGIILAPEFLVLRESPVPAVILELLFLSNPTEAARLANPEVQMLIAEALAAEIANLRFVPEGMD